MSIIINGSPSKPFQVERGLRQGDPLSPFLFVLVTEVLNQLISKVEDCGLIDGIQIGKHRVNILHLQFANDTILFCLSRYETIVSYRRILDCFGVMSGLRINYDKSALIPIHCDEVWVEQMKDILGCTVLSLPIRYLGILLGANSNRVETWQPVIHSIKKRLSSWKSHILSKAGRIVLIQSVLNNLPIFYLSLFRMPRTVAKEIISIQQHFSGEKNRGKNSIP